MSLHAGARLGSYEVLELIGAGGMGEVYKARDTRLDREVALKILGPFLAQDPDRRARFHREARVLASLNHPNIVAVHSVEEAGGVPFFTMELVNGAGLAELIPAAGMSPRKAIELCVPIAAALVAAHARGIIHRDLKPANVMIARDGTVKVLDFGIAKALGPDDQQGAVATRTALTVEGTAVGTPHYMSPEQAQGREVDARSDLFAFGVILYELLSGRRPFDGDSDALVLSKVLTDEPALLTNLRPELPPELARLVARCLKKDPAERMQSSVDLLHALQELQEDRPAGEGAALGAGAVRRRRVRRLAAAASVFAGVAVLTVLFWRFDVGGSRGVAGGASGAPVISSLAVLPLESLSSDPAQQYFAEGMTDQLITAMAQLRSLRVISRTSAMRLKGSRLPMEEIARQLDVDAVIEGSVLRDGDRIRITAQLIGTRPERHLWARSYDRHVRDILGVQSEIARAIADEVHVEASGAEGERLGAGRSVAPAALEAYWRGRALFDRGNPDAARAEWERAIVLDPGYAEPYAMLADYWAFGLPVHESMERARTAATKALALDDRLAEAHTALGLVHLYYDWDFEKANHEFARALDLGPGSAYVLGRYAEYCWATGRTREAVQTAERAKHLDPLNAIVLRDLGRSYYFDRQFARAVEELRKYVEAAPNNRLSHFFLGIAADLAGDRELAVKEVSASYVFAGNPQFAQTLEAAHASGGYPRFLEAWASLSEQLVAVGRAQPASVAMMYARAGHRDKALAWLETSFTARSRALVLLRTEPQFDPLRGDPRFDDLVRRVGIPKR